MKEEVMRVRVLSRNGAPVVIDRFYPREGRIVRIKRIEIQIRKLEEPVPCEIVI